MGHSAAGRDTEKLVGNGTGRSGTAADVGGPGAGDSGIRPLCPAGAKLQHRPPLRGAGNAIGLCGHKALVVKCQQQERLHKLRLNSRSADGNDRLVGENRCALGNGPDVPGELEIPQILQKALGEQLLAPKVRDILLRKMQV